MIARVLILVVALPLAAWLAFSYRDARLTDHATAISRVARPSRAQLLSALADVRSAQRLNPDRTTSLTTEAGIDVLLGRFAAARRVAEENVRREPDNVDAWAFLTELTQQSDPARSAQAFAQVRRLDPLDAKKVHP